MALLTLNKTDGKRLCIDHTEIVALEEMGNYCVLKTVIEDYEVVHSFDEIQSAMAMSEASERGNAFNGIKYSES